MANTSAKAINNVGLGAKKGFLESVRSDFSTLSLLLISIGVAVNFVGDQLNSLLKLPLYLDTIGTLLTAVLAGPWAGAVAGVLTNVVSGIANPISLAFIPVNLAVGLIAGYLAKKSFFAFPVNIVKWALAVLIVTAVSITVAAPILVFAFGGLTGNGASLVAAAFIASGHNIWSSVIGWNGVFNLVDRIVSLFVVWAVIKVIPDRQLVKFSQGSKYIKNRSGE